MPHHRARARASFVLGTIAALASACAMANDERRLLLNLLDAHWTPTSTTGRWLAAPVALPTGIVAGLTDAVVVHPSTQFDDAWRDTCDALWDFDTGSQFRNVLVTPLSAVATPVVFGTVWLVRAVFDIDDHEPEASEHPEAGR